MTIRVQAAAFDPGTEVNALHAANLGIGAVVSFVGYVRDFNEGREVSGMFLEHYPGMTEKALAKIVEEAEQRWPLLRLDVLHRVGALEPGEPIVFVGVASAIGRPHSRLAISSWITSRPVRRSGRRKILLRGRSGSRVAIAIRRPPGAGSSRCCRCLTGKKSAAP